MTPPSPGSPAGPDGSAPLPPSWLASMRLPIDEHAQGAPLFRVHASAWPPVFFGPGPNRPPAFRFDSASGSFGVLYAAPGPEAALVETLLRRPQRLVVDARAEVAPRSLATLRAGRPLRLVRAWGDGLSRLGTTAALSSGPYAASQAWSDALFEHPDRPDGIAFASRHDNAELCVAIFERADIEIEVLATRPLLGLATEIGALLDRHGKALTGL